MSVPSALLTPRAILLGSVAGAATGALVALVADRMFRRQEHALMRGLLIDAMLGAVGFVGGAIGFASLPSMESSTTTRAGGMIIHSVTHHYEDAYRLALGSAALLAVLYEVIRNLPSRRAPKPT